MEKPIVSLNMGCSAIFLIGGRSKEDRPVPVLVRSGDVLVMAGESRYCFHGVPCILPHTFQYGDGSMRNDIGDRHGGDDKSDGEDDKNDEWVDDRNIDRLESTTDSDRTLLQYLKQARININVRQVTVDPRNDTLWVEKCGSGAMNASPSSN